MPLLAEASFFSSLLGTNASADSVDTISSATGSTSDQSGKNSQTMGLLQASVSSASVVAGNDNNKSNDSAVNTDANVNIVSSNALLPSTSTATISGDTTESPDSSANEVSVYVVRKGDTISQIADMFGVSVNTILWNNDMKKGDKLTEGQTLLILPVSGIQHTVAKGQTLKGIAKLYKVDVSDIAGFNGIDQNAPLAVGDVLIIPDGEKSDESGTPIKNPSASIAKDKLYYEQHPVTNFSGYYVDPVPGYRLSQGIHDNNAVDLAIASGTPIHAAADGVVTLARYGYNGGFGNFVIISHPNGTETLYAHQSKLATTTGAHVTQGQVIGYVGTTGHSTGPHLHFEVHGARNPGADDSWAN